MALPPESLRRWRHKGAWVAFAAWLAWRCLTPDGGIPLQTAAWSGALVFFYVDASGLLLVLALLLWSRAPLTARGGWFASGALAVVIGAQLFLLATDRYVAGAARAWDLANYVQPMWRAAHGLSMSSAAYDHRPVWADHGAFAMFVFAPWTRLTSHATTGLFLVQSALVAGSVPVAYALGRALALPAWVALAGAAVLGSSRALAQAARFDFHPECALPVLLLGVACAHVRGRWVWALLLSAAACTLRDVAAMTVAMLWLYWAVTERSRVALLTALSCAAVAVLDVVWLPAWTGWQSYLAMHGSASPAVLEGLATTFLRGLSTFGVGWLHPVSWFAGAPWAVAAALSPKLLVKGIDFQYGFLFVPVAALGALHVITLVQERRAHWLQPAVLAWVALALAVNAPLASSVATVRDSAARLDRMTQAVARLVPPDASVVADACAAPYVLERANLTLLCRLDGKLLQTRGIERWEELVPDALEASHMVVRQDCEANGPCARVQLERAQRELGFRLIGREGPFVVLRRDVSSAHP